MFRRFLSFNVKNLKDHDDKIYNSLLNLNIETNVVIYSKNIYRLRKKVRSIIHVLRTFRNT